MHDALSRQHPAPAVDEGAAERPLIEPHRDLVRKAGEHAALNRAGFGFAALRSSRPSARAIRDELLPELRGLARGGDR